MCWISWVRDFEIVMDFSLHCPFSGFCPYWILFGYVLGFKFYCYLSQDLSVIKEGAGKKKKKRKQVCLFILLKKAS